MIQIDMNMPKVCGECPFSETEGREYPYCSVLKQDKGYPFDTGKKKFPNCPLKSVEERKAETNKMCGDALIVLFNRCKAVLSSGGLMCGFCGIRDECERMRSV